jgi:hypothetical protein
VGLTVNGRPLRLKLTLGVLAALEAHMEADTLVGLVERFETGRFSTADVIELLYAGLQGGGWQGSRETLLTADIKGGPMEATRVAALLLGRAFSIEGLTS